MCLCVALHHADRVSVTVAGSGHPAREDDERLAETAHPSMNELARYIMKAQFLYNGYLIVYMPSSTGRYVSLESSQLRWTLGIRNMLDLDQTVTRIQCSLYAWEHKTVQARMGISKLFL